MAMMTVRNDNSRFPFTSSQWQELEHQALVYKYMISGMPIPPDLLFSIKTSLDSSTKLFLHRQSPHNSVGWDYFQMGFGKKFDPEPGRCRRTDGKKWRCSKEAYLDSKYCERHMHRGRNRSIKPVEAKLSTNSTSSSSICTKLMKHRSSDSHPPFINPQLLSPISPVNVLSSQDRFLLESNSRTYSHSEKDRSGIVSVGDSWLLEPLAVNNNQLALKIEGKDETLKVMHHFFDESPDNDNDDHNKDKDSSTTQLSMSIPSGGHDFFLTRKDE